MKQIKMKKILSKRRFSLFWKVFSILTRKIKHLLVNIFWKDKKHFIEHIQEFLQSMIKND